MIIEVVKKKESPKYEDLKIGSTFYLSSGEDADLYLKVRAHPNTSMNCVNLTRSKLCVCCIKASVIEVKTKVINS